MLSHCYNLLFPTSILKLDSERYIFSLGKSFSNIIILCFQVLIFLVYPLLGHLADVYLTRYRTLKCGLVIIVANLAVVSLCTAVSEIFNLEEVLKKVLHKYFIIFGGILVVIFAVAAVAGVGLFEANAIQFGLDQLLEAPTPKLITFIHWYYWSQNVGGLVVFYTYYLGNFAIFEACIMSVKFGVEKTIIPLIEFLVILLVTVATLVLLFCYF